MYRVLTLVKQRHLVRKTVREANFDLVARPRSLCLVVLAHAVRIRVENRVHVLRHRMDSCHCDPLHSTLT